MIRKFATVPGYSLVLSVVLMTILAGVATVYAQETPAQDAPAQQPQTQPPSGQQPDTSQEPSTEEFPVHKPKPKEFKDWNFNVGGGASLTSGNTRNFVRGGGGVVAAGVARNYSKYFGFRLDFQFDNLPLRPVALQAALAPGGNSHVYSLTFGPIINIPVSANWGGYVIGGPAFFHRSGKLDSSTALPGWPCNPFFLWWGHCFSGNLPVSGNFLHSSENEFGEHFGGGIYHKIRPNMEVYAEIRYFHGSYNRVTTDLRPITLGIRW